jgi:hypothetical protein
MLAVANRKKRQPIEKAAIPGDAAAERRITGIINQGWSIMDQGLMKQHTMDMIAARSADGVEASLPWSDLIQHLGQTVTPMATQVGRTISSEIGKIGDAKAKLAFGNIDALSAKYAQEQSGQLIRNITDSQRATIRGILGTALNGDYTTAQAAAKIRQGIGLHPAWAQAVQNYRDRMLRAPVPKGFSPGRWATTIDARTERYQQRLVSRRAQNIARTEIMTAENTGRYATWAQSIGNGMNSPASRKEWSAGPGACPQCTGLAGEIVQWDQSFSSGDNMPPAHTNCRCSAELVPPEYSNPALNPRPINWTDPFGDHEAEGRLATDVGQSLLDGAGEDALGGAAADAAGGTEEDASAPPQETAAPETAAPELSAYEKDLRAMQEAAVRTQADQLTYESTLHWSDDKLMAAITKYADDPESVDKILDIIDQREVVAAQRAEQQQFAADTYKPIVEDTNPILNPAARPARALTADQRVEEEYSAYVYTQYAQAMEETNGVFFKKGMAQVARDKGVDEISLFTGQYKTATKYASDELQAFWHAHGRESLGSYRYRALGRASDKWYADVVRNNGLMRGQAASDRSQF